LTRRVLRLMLQLQMAWRFSASPVGLRGGEGVYSGYP